MYPFGYDKEISQAIPFHSENSKHQDMKNYIIVLVTVFSILQVHAVSVRAQEIRLHVVEANSSESIPFATIAVEYCDTIIGSMTDTEGAYSFTPRSLPLNLKVSGFGMEESSMSISTIPDSLVTVKLQPGSIELQEVAVIGRLINQTNSGISYNMAANRRAQSENTLQSLSYVPLVNVDADGSISVQGSSSYSLYLNGRPYEMAQTSPKVFLESLSASSIKKVEVITHPDNRFGADSQRYILNIVLKQPMLEGYVVNLSAEGNTQPTANGSLMGMIKKNKVDASINYTYNLNGQRHQPTDITYTEKDEKGDITHIWRNEGKGNGDWHTHTVRAMLKWEIDSLNTLYADAHGQILQTNITDSNIQSEMFPIAETPETFIRNLSKYTSGAAEANLIYRNYFNNDSETERITAGYHYTYNPDRRHQTQNRQSGESNSLKYIQRTDGGLNAHTGLFSYLLRPSLYHSIRFTASDMYRQGKTESNYYYENDLDEPGCSMRYTNNIAALNIAYAGWLGKIYCLASLKGNYDHFSMRLPLSPSLNYKRDRLYFLPSASIFWRPDNYNALYLDYSTSLNRPGINMLNPFESSNNDHSVNRGNPNLKAQYNHDIALTWYMTKIRNLTLAASVQYTHSSDVILSDYYTKNEKMVYTFSNFGNADQTDVSVNIGYEPTNWIKLTMDGSIGKRWLRGESSNLRQNDLVYSITPRVDLYLPNHFRIGGKFGYYKNMPNPWSSRSALTLYSFYVSKSFLSGRLNVSVTANSPFSKYNHSKTVTTLPAMVTEQNNYMTARSFGINLSYSFGGGQKVKIERDRTLDSTDQNTGVK